LGNVSDPKAPAGIINTNDGVVFFDWYRASTALSLLNGNASIDTPGISDNTIFDTLLYDGPVVNGSATVNQTTFRVVCGRLPQDPVITSSFDNAGNLMLNFLSTGDDGAFLNMTDTLVYNAAFDAAHANPTFVFPFGSRPRVCHILNVMALLTCRTDINELDSAVLVHVPQSQNVSNTMGRNLMLYNMFYSNTSDAAFPPTIAGPIVDSSGNPGPAFTVSVNTSAFNSAFNVTALPFTVSIQVIGCSLNVSQETATIDTATNNLLEEPTRQDNRTLGWDAFTPNEGKEDGYISLLPHTCISLRTYCT
jgi:hypothetical protein